MIVNRYVLYVLSWTIQLSGQGGWDPINRFNPATFVCLSHARIWISNNIWRCLFLCSVSSVQMRGGCSCCCYWWNWLPSMLSLSLHAFENIVVVYIRKEVLIR